MNKCLLSLVAAGVLFSVSGATWAEQTADPKAQGDAGQQKPAELDRTIKVTMKYLIYLPKDYDQKDSWPLMLFLHGAGERGDNLNRVKQHGPPKLIDAGKQFPFILVSPQCPTGQSWEPFKLTALLDEITEKYKVDQDRIYLTGLSMGGFGTWALAAHTPNRFAAIVPICGGGDPSRVRRIVRIPTWVFHGGKDPTVPIENSKKMVEALKKAGGDPKFTIYPDAGHDSWTQAYNTPELYEWLLAQKRTAKKVEDSKK